MPKSLTVFLLDLFFLALLLDDVLKSQSQDCWLFRQLRLLKFSNIGDIFGLNLVTQPCNLDITLQSLDFIKQLECLSGLFMVDLIIFITQNIFLGYHKIFSSIPCLAVIISLEKHSENCQSTVCVHWTNCPAGRGSSRAGTQSDRQTDGHYLIGLYSQSNHPGWILYLWSEQTQPDINIEVYWPR